MIKEISSLTREDISSIADGLTLVNVNLLSVALKSANLSEAQKLVTETINDTGIDITDSKALHDLSDGSINELQRYETAVRTKLITYVGKYYETSTQTTHQQVKDDKTLSFMMKLSVGLYIFFGMFVIGILWIPMPETQMRYVDYILGFLSSSIAATITVFWFGKYTNKKDEKNSSENEEQK